MNPSKIDESLEIVGDEPKDVYYKNVVPLLLQNASDQAITQKVRQEGEMTRLTREHEHVDKAIAAMLEKIKNTHEKSAELDRQIHLASQRKNQAQARSQTTGQICNVLKDEADKLKYHAKRVEDRRLEITKKVQDFAENRRKNEEKKKKIDDLRRHIQELQDEPEIKLNENLVKENADLKERLLQKKEELGIKRTKKGAIAEMKEEKINLLMKISKKQEENRTKKEELDKKKASTKKIQEELIPRCEELVEKIKNETAKRDNLVENMTESMERCVQKQLQIEEQKTNICEKEAKLADLKQKCAARQDAIKEENEGKQKELEIEKEKLAKIEEKVQTQLDNNAENLNVLNKTIEELTELKAKENDLTARIYDQKIRILTRQLETKDKEICLSELVQQLNSKRNEVEQARQNNEEMEKQRKELEDQLKQLPRVYDEKQQKFKLEHQSKIEMLFNQQSLHKASMELVQHRLDNSLKEAKQLKEEIKGLEETNAWKEMAVNRSQAILNSTKARIKKEQAAYEKVLKQWKKQKETPRVETIVAEKDAEKNKKSDKKDFTALPVMIEGDSGLMEINGTGDKEEQKQSSSGRRSPGILKKSIEERKRPQTPPKKVTFEGLSSTESSSAGSSVENNLEKLIKDWSKETKAHTKRTPMDF